ncbi:oxidoreductase [Microbacterium excoecariae]|uniref:oxidoreductase n=1 Tax=Microbacterium excoecariae TaxID=2715210 RepID=UPI0014072F4E|nr:oxidoreductase [Microbacterium excoecariae]NHI17670.1 oxidoreductase [Microbacterium excoecariae]
MTPALFAPLALRDLTLRNRIGVSPMCMYACHDETGTVTDWHVVHYGQFALGGAGLVITEATAVSPEGRVTPQDAGLWDDAHVDAWRRVTDAVHRAGGRIAVQLAHAGRKGGKYAGLPDEPAEHRGSVPLDRGGWATRGVTGEAFGHYAPPVPMGPEEVPGLVAAFAHAARRAVAAGFDAVEIHAAHGYLLHELLSPVTNPEGSDREAPLREVVRAVRAEAPAGFPVIVRLSVDDVAEGGLTAEDSAGLARRLVSDGADLIDCSSGGLVWGAEYAPAPGYQVPGAARVRREGVPVAAVGLIADPDHAEALVAGGEADLVLLGREMLRDPHWARRAESALAGAATIEPRYHRAYL